MTEIQIDPNTREYHAPDGFWVRLWYGGNHGLFLARVTAPGNILLAQISFGSTEAEAIADAEITLAEMRDALAQGDGPTEADWRV